MKFGIFPVEGGDSWDGVVEQCRVAERVGFETCWVNDHQATEGDNYWPSPLTRLTSIATGTETLELVTSVLILPLYHPLHVAQRAAMLDNISDGRLTLGVGLGYVEKEFDAFDVPMDERAGRMIEGIQFIDEFLSSDEPISFECPFFEVEDWQPLPQTVQSPRPPLWIGGWGDKQISRSVKFSDAWVPGVVADLETVEDRKRLQREHVERSEQDWESMDHPLMREAVIAETEEEVMERKEYLHRTYIDEYGGEFSHPLMTADSVEEFEELADDRFIYGTPEQVIEQIESMRERFALNQLTLRFHHSGMPKELVEDQIRLFGEEVIPAFE
ncbi:LLM class flavin-dependent oxidoreductase [Halopelagius longus]|uniref:Flavin-dependent oxidoreductase, luciferase family (Includes alkanesulfonate monooxygenase SsuD and methylene tetrahydromethanopterin reductase) n=1 Tax=Halopelagius longus TaxID=1236180 RepID=A0A1H1G4D5_9EURY|nr:LLM class flavin-dependent oxidoreductase [Halopelagius longus]RDI69849.1 LLM class flavin-dependent oxidoreductase [Halopelagius longus]SDR08094.1 Flavin-dependent oxidoreductase, luciferase family (includes alkanesulfonate monooxygenase SsuD and methylene tetrahydromethanopterin reductase) [Halopelagius longus]